jgi:TM2 domain-containing membrane protein YozV
MTSAHVHYANTPSATPKEIIVTSQTILPPVRAKSPAMVRGLACLGFIGIAGIHRFYLGKIGTGILWFLTGGMFVVGTIVDICRGRKMAVEADYRNGVAIDIQRQQLAVAQAQLAATTAQTQAIIAQQHQAQL